MNSSMFSVIVPVYNVEKYLEQCVGSITNQTYRDIEVILVDDGSVDNSSKICDDLAKKDGRIKVIHKANEGLSEARNVGLSIATGKYVMFVDSDDFWENDKVLEKLDNYIITYGDVDFINFNCIYYYQVDHKFRLWPRFPDVVINGESREQIIVGLISHGMFPMSACMKVIRRDFLLKNNIYFKKGIISEDIPWFLELILVSDRFRFINEYLYVYRKQVVGTLSSSFSEKKYGDIFDIVESAIQKILKYDLAEQVRYALMSFMAYEYCILLGLVNDFDINHRKLEFAKLERYKWILKYDLNPKVRLVKRVKQLLGLRMTSCILGLYIKKYVNRI